jgi:hypothetical protein
MALTIEQRFTANFLHHVQKMSVSMIAIAMIADEKEVQDWIDIGEDYIAGEKPRRRPKREEANTAETTAPRTRARTTPAASSETEKEAGPTITPPKPREADADRASFSPAA